MTPQQLTYIRDWARNGNDAKFACDIEDLLPEELGAWRMLDKHEDSLCELTPAAVMLAAALDALEQANETAEFLVKILAHEGQTVFGQSINKTRANRKELLG